MSPCWNTGTTSRKLFRKSALFPKRAFEISTQGLKYLQHRGLLFLLPGSPRMELQLIGEIWPNRWSWHAPVSVSFRVSLSICCRVNQLCRLNSQILFIFHFYFYFFAIVGWSVTVERPCVELDAAILSQIRKLTKCAKHLFYQKKEGVWWQAKRKLYNHKSTYTGLLEHGQKLLCSLKYVVPLWLPVVLMNYLHIDMFGFAEA